MENIHLIMYSHREPYNSTKQMCIQSIRNHTKYNVIIHDYSLEKIQQLPWWNKISFLPTITGGDGRRDGYYNLWKAFIVKDVYETIGDKDLLFYVDSSQHFRHGFTQDIDKLCDYAFEKGCVAGSIGYDLPNNLHAVLHKINVWKKILPSVKEEDVLTKQHLLNAWFLFTKSETHTKFIDDWVYYSVYTDNEFTNPLATYHHTVDQSIFNILVHKYNLPFYFEKNTKHNDNKDKNRVLKVINEAEDIDSYITYFNTCK